MSRAVRPAVVVIVCVYLVLTVTAAFCLPALAGTEPPVSHHHPGSSEHSSLCAWACQVNQPSETPLAVSQPQEDHLVGPVSIRSVEPSVLVVHTLTQLRAPPRT